MLNALKWLSFLIVYTLTLVGHASNAQTQQTLIFGPEWTFTNEALLAMNETESGVQYFIEDIQDRFATFCKSSGRCEFKKIQDNFKFGQLQFKDGFVVSLTKDYGVFEMQSSPQNLKQWRQKKEEVQEIIFNVMVSEGFVPHKIIGAGHVNIGLSYFKDKPLLLRNFIVDFYNQPGLGIVLNSLAENSLNAKSLDQMSSEDQKEFIRQLAKLDQIKNLTMEDIFKTIRIPLAKKNIGIGLRDVGISKIGLKEIGPKGTFEIGSTSRLEIRALHPQANMDDFIKVLEIFEARIKFLESIDTPIPIAAIKKISDPRVALGQYADYLEQAGLNLKSYESLMLQEWQGLQASSFLRSKTNLGSKKNNYQCKKLF
ncbi:MAG: hypothetical protein WA160_12445 [Pseudobdellovibrio sp.]